MKEYRNITTSKRLLISSLLIIFIIFGCDKEVSRSPVEAPPSEGAVYVSSIPNGFTIYLNDRNTGRLTPDSLTFLEAANYQVTLKKKYFRDTTITVSVEEAEKVTVEIDILSNPAMYGRLSLATQPTGASIYINDSLITGITPRTISHLLPGIYQVKLSLVNHRDINIDAVVRSSETTVYNEQMRDTSLWVDYRISNSNIQSDQLTAITIDNAGMKWIGTVQKGLIRYDENNFVNYNTLNSQIPSNKVQCLEPALNGDIWVGTDLGLGIFNGVSWTVYNNSNSGLTSNSINAIQFGNPGVTWIGSTSGLYKFDGVNWVKYNDEERRIWVTDFKIDNEQKIWIGTKEYGIVSLFNEELIYYPDSAYEYPTNRISSVDIDQNGYIWFCHMPDSARRSGVSFWDGSMFTNIYLGTISNNVNHIYIDDLNNKWVSTYEGFVWFDEQNNSTIFSTLNSLISSNLVNASTKDNNENVWITTSGSGLNKLKVNNFQLE